MKKSHKIINETKIGQQKLLELLIIVIFLAFGIDLISGQTLIYFNINPFLAILIGLIFCLISIIIFINQILHERRLTRTIEAFFIYDENSNTIIDIPNYQFSSDMISNLNAVLVENVNLKRFWESKPLSLLLAFHENEGNSKEKNTIKIINELTEYLILEKLSTHLTDYFNQRQIPENRIKTYERRDIPDILLQNRFLETISHPMDERPFFSHEEDRYQDKFGNEIFPKGEIISASGEDGVLFNRFDLILPKESKITKPNANEIIVETDILRLFIKTDFRGMNTFIPTDFIKNYLDLEFSQDYLNTRREFSIPITIKVNMKLKSLFLKSGLEYYEWVDSFIEEIEDYLSEDAFFDKIKWKSIQATLICMKNLKNQNTNE